MNNLYVRMALYILSPILTSLVPLIAGFGVDYSDGVVSVDLEALLGAVVGAAGLSGAVLAKWGIKS